MLKKIKDFIKSNPIVTVKFALYTVLLIVSAIMGYRSEDKYIIQFWIVAQIVLIILILRLIYKSFLKKKLADVYNRSIGAIKKLYRNIEKLSKRFFSRFGRKEKGVFIEGKSTYSFFFNKRESREESKKEKRKKRKWSDIQSNYERLRFIYSVTVTRKIKNGAKIKSTSTPFEICNEYSENETERELFLCYNDNRYKERPDIDEDNSKLQLFSETLEKHDKK